MPRLIFSFVILGFFLPKTLAFSIQTYPTEDCLTLLQQHDITESYASHFYPSCFSRGLGNFAISKRVSKRDKERKKPGWVHMTG